MRKSCINRKAYVFILLFFIGPFHALFAQQKEDSTVNQLQPLRIDKDFEITGTLSNPLWQQGQSVFIKHEVQPNDQAAAPVKTEVKVLYSANNLYIGFISSDPHPDKIRAHVSDRDNSGNDDYVGLLLDPFNNNRQAYEFFINPLGIQMDFQRTGNDEDINFDALWYSKGVVSDSGYTAVMKIPFKSLNFPRQDIQNWSIQFFRNYPRSNRYQLVWTDIDISNSCLICQNGQLTNIQGVESHKTVELLPYGLSHQGGAIRNPDDPSSGLDNGPVKAQVGGSISYAPTSTSELNAVINPDFSQVETDAAQIGVNQTFALYYDEKRPFFLKEADLFTTPEDLFYSRTINHPLAAGKFTKKANRYSVAFLTAYDRDIPYIIPGLESSSLIKSSENAYDNIFRGKYNIGSQSYVGGLVTTRNQTQAYNYVGSIDWSFFLGGHYYFNGQAAYSDTREMNDTTLFNDPRTFGHSSYDAALNGQQFGGTLLGVNIERNAKYYNFSAEYTSFSPTFQTQNGFINKTDRRQIEGNQSISYYPDKAWLSQGSFSTHGSWRYDFAGQFQERFMNARWSNTFAGQTQLSINYFLLNDERFRGRLFTGAHRASIEISTKPLDIISLNSRLETGRYIYRVNNPTLGHGYSFSAQATIKPTSRLDLNINYDYSTLSSLDDAVQYYSGDIVRLKGTYNFSRKLFARVITQYDSFEKQIQLYPLLYYKVNPFTKFYIGMTGYANHFDEPGPNGFRGYRQTSREFFVKFQYLIQG